MIQGGYRLALAGLPHGECGGGTNVDQAVEDSPSLVREVDWEGSLDGYLLGSYRIATAPEPNSSRLTSFKSICFDSPANNVGP